MALVVRVDRGERVGRFSRRRKAEHALAVRQERAGSRVLHDDRLSAREIAQGPIADPGVLELDVRALGAAELTSRILDVRLICFRGRRDVGRVADAPAASFQIVLLRHITFRAHEERQLQRLSGHPWQIRKFQKGDALGVFVRVVAIDDPIGGIPVRDRREGFAAAIEHIWPRFEAHRRPDVNPGTGKAFADREVKIVARHAELSAADPELQ